MSPAGTACADFDVFFDSADQIFTEEVDDEGFLFFQIEETDASYSRVDLDDCEIEETFTFPELKFRATFLVDNEDLFVVRIEGKFAFAFNSVDEPFFADQDFGPGVLFFNPGSFVQSFDLITFESTYTEVQGNIIEACPLLAGDDSSDSSSSD